MGARTQIRGSVRRELATRLPPALRRESAAPGGPSRGLGGRRARVRPYFQRRRRSRSCSCGTSAFAIAHDLIFVPIYTGLDRVMRAGARATVAHPGASEIPMINHVRAPVLIIRSPADHLRPADLPAVRRSILRLTRPSSRALSAQLVADHRGAVPRLGCHLPASRRPPAEADRARRFQSDPNCSVAPERIGRFHVECIAGTVTGAARPQAMHADGRKRIRFSRVLIR